MPPPGMTAMAKILIVEDDHTIRSLFAAALKRERVIVDTARDGIEALDKLRQLAYSVVVLDIMMPRMNGADFLAAYPAVTAARPVILVVTAFDHPTVMKIVGDKVHAVLRKPFDIERFVDVVRDCAFAHAAATAASKLLPATMTRGEASH